MNSDTTVNNAKPCKIMEKCANDYNEVGASYVRSLRIRYQRTVNRTITFPSGNSVVLHASMQQNVGRPAQLSTIRQRGYFRNNFCSSNLIEAGTVENRFETKENVSRDHFQS